jgi:hypothetical protein
VDERRRAGEKPAQFLLLDSASPELLQQSSETLARRISYLEMHRLDLSELAASLGIDGKTVRRLIKDPAASL